MDLIQKASKLGYKHYTEFTVEELDNLSLGNSNKQIEYYFIQKWIRETRGVHIEIHRNASGWFWSMCKSKSGTNLGYSEFSGPNGSGVWDEHDDALENALQVQLSYDLPNSLNVIKHWGNYVEIAIETFRNMAI